MSEIISPSGKSESSRHHPGKYRARFKTSQIPISLRLFIIVAFVAAGLLGMTLFLRVLDKPTLSSPPGLSQ